MPETILNRRLKKGNNIVYPITSQENVIGLQATIKEKLPIVSDSTPEQFVAGQVWLNTSSASGSVIASVSLRGAKGGRGLKAMSVSEPSSASETGLGFGQTDTDSELGFGQTDTNIELGFGS